MVLEPLKKNFWASECQDIILNRSSPKVTCKKANTNMFLMSQLYLYLLSVPFLPVCNTHPHASTHHLPLPQLQMSPLVRVQCTLCCRPIMAAEISIMIITVPSAAISTDGRSLFRNELSTHQRAHCRLCYLARCAHNSVSVCVITCVQPHMPSLHCVWWALKGKLVIKSFYTHANDGKTPIFYSHLLWCFVTVNGCH